MILFRVFESFKAPELAAITSKILYCNLLRMEIERIPYTVYRIPYTVYRIPSTVYRIPYTVYRIPYTVYRIPYTVYRIGRGRFSSLQVVDVSFYQYF